MGKPVRKTRTRKMQAQPQDQATPPADTTPTKTKTQRKDKTKPASPQLALDFDNAPRRKYPILGIAEFQAYIYGPKLDRKGNPTGKLNFDEHRRIAAEKGESYLSRYVHPELAADMGVEVMLERIEKLQDYLRRNTFLKGGYNFFGILNAAILRAIIDRQRKFERDAKSNIHRLSNNRVALAERGQLSDGDNDTTNDDLNTEPIGSEDTAIVTPSSPTSHMSLDAIKAFITDKYDAAKADLMIAMLLEEKDRLPSLLLKAQLSAHKARALMLRVKAECLQWFTPEPITVDNHDGSRYIILPTWKDGKRYCAVQYVHACTNQSGIVGNESCIYLGQHGRPKNHKHGFTTEEQAREAITQHQER